MMREFFPVRILQAAGGPAYHRAMKTAFLASLRRDSLWRDLAIAVGAALLAAVLAAQVELHEQIFDATRRFEHLELDEWPSALLVFALCMVVLYARRHAQLRRVLGENRYLVRRLIEVQEEERRRLARELHDELGQTLNAIKLDALSLPGNEAAQRIAAHADQVYAAAGGLVRRLRPTALDELGLRAALEACVDRWRQSHPQLNVQLSMSGELDELGEARSLAIYRIVQEGLTNCVRHAGAGHFYIDLTRDPAPGGGVLLEMRDDGRGLPREALRPRGSGLSGMRERVALLGGRFELLSEPGRGVTIRVEIPVETEER
jgi:two-component system sensor histidine kinase UhpB|nr:MAG: two-component sensor histidine kinase [Pseudomonadota bacterium]